MRRAVLLALCLGASVAEARGVFSEAGLGATIFVGPTAEHADPGPAFSGRLGWAFAPWISLGARVAASVHEATVPPPPRGELFQLYQLGLDARAQLRLGRVGLFAEAGGGVAIVSTNVLDAVGITSPTRHLSPYLAAGAGVELRTGNPRFAFGLAGDFNLYPDFDATQAVGARLYLRYSR